mmetsp:Transcript_38022/g.119353  ORF Transcript_38022/g.119353 Transcript_38022/m.119353 type:complete len:228 (-) Transcript_38022:74-757(-)
MRLQLLLLGLLGLWLGLGVGFVASPNPKPRLKLGSGLAAKPNPNPKLSMAARGIVQPATRGLGGTRWQVTLDFGREKNTWMPPNWASSGLRVEVPLLLELGADGTATPLAEGAYANVGAAPGSWEVEGEFPRERLQANVELRKGYERGDNKLPPGTKLFMSIPVFEDRFSARGGTLTVLQRRWLVREERRIVGTFTVDKRIDNDVDVTEAERALPTARTYNDDRNIE